MAMDRRHRIRLLAWFALGCLFAGACSVAIGVDDYDFDGPQSSAGTATSGTGSGGGGTSTSGSASTSSGSCGAKEKYCPGPGCVSIDNPLFGCGDGSCAGCNLPQANEICVDGACAVGSCNFGWADCDPNMPGCETDVGQSNPSQCGGCNTVCPMGASCCGAWCSKLTDDPLNCGQCGKSCQSDEYCVNGQCECRPGFTLINGDCRNTQTDVNNCGMMGTFCSGANDLCESGACVGDCIGAGHFKCDDGCVNYNTDVEHCGQCDNARCDTDELCSEGNCVNWRPASSVGCSSCPCPACSSVLGLPLCVNYPGTSIPICTKNP